MTRTELAPGVAAGPYVGGGMLRSSDAFSWRMEGDPALRSTVVSLLVLDRAPDWPELVDRVEHLTHEVPVLRELIRADSLRVGPPRFVTAHSVDLTHHLRRIRAIAPGNLASLLELARIDGEEAFDPARPLWRITLVEAAQVPSAADDEVPGRAAVIIKMHHSIADGLGALQIATHLFDTVRHSTAARPADPRPAHALPVPAFMHDAADDATGMARGIVGLPGLAVRVVASTARHPRRTLRTAASIVRFVAPVSSTMSPVMTARGLERRYQTLDVDLSRLRGAAEVTGGTVNDAFLAAVTGGLDRYQGRHGYSSFELRVTMPISVRRPGDGEGGNRLTLVRFPVPVRDPDPVHRMREIGERIRARRRDPALAYTAPIAAVLNVLPRPYLGSMLKHVDFLASNVVGFPMPVYLAGARVLRQYPFGPTIGAALNITLLSYSGHCCIGVTLDSSAIPDGQVLLTCLQEGFAEVGALAGAPGSRSRADRTTPTLR